MWFIVIVECRNEVQLWKHSIQISTQGKEIGFLQNFFKHLESNALWIDVHLLGFTQLIVIVIIMPNPCTQPLVSA